MATDPNLVRILAGKINSQAINPKTGFPYQLTDVLIPEYVTAVIPLLTSPHILSVAPISISTIVGAEPTLPSSFPVTMSDNSIQDQPCTWHVIDPSSYAVEGTFSAKGTINNTAIIVTANVTVVAVL